MLRPAFAHSPGESGMVVAGECSCSPEISKHLHAFIQANPPHRSYNIFNSDWERS